MVVEEGFAAIWKVATATTPSAMVAAFTPKTRHVPPEQVTVFPAVLAETDATTVTPVMSLE